MARFSAGPEGRGLLFCAVFAPAGGAREAAETPGAEETAKAGADSSSWVSVGDRLSLVPASLAKLATTALALERFGPGFTYKTRIRAEGPVLDGVLRGNLVVSGGGDPFLVSERLWLLAGELRKTGLTRVTGNLVLDASGFAPPARDPARARDREVAERPYAAGLSALAVNFNAAAFDLAPGSAPGARGSVRPNPLPCSWIRVENRLMTGPPGSQEAWTVSLAFDSSGEVARVAGLIPAGSAPQTVYRSVGDPDRFSISLLRAFLEQAGIRIDGGILLRAASPQAHLLTEFSSLPLSQLLSSTNRYSNNFMADLIAVSLGDSLDASGASAGASLTRGAARLTRWLREELEAGSEVRLEDGSGLNPEDHVTGALLLRLLRHAWADLRIQPDFVASLPVPGDEGTLKRRFKNGTPRALRAKTGTMATPLVSGMAGYVQDRKLGPVAFVILMNPVSGSSWELPRLQALQEAWVRRYLD